MNSQTQFLLCVLIIGGIAAVLFFLVQNHEGPAEIGGQEIPLTFNVIDEGNQHPIANASVRIMWIHDTEVARGLSAGRTDGQGSVSLSPELTFTSQSKGFRRSGWIRFWDRAIEVTAEGYLPLTDTLDTYAGRAIPLFDPPPSPITLKMKRTPSRKQ